MTVYNPQIIEYIWVLRRDTQHDIHLPEFGGVLLHTMPLPFLEVMLTDPLVLCIPNRVELGLNEGF
jgi:hypothetical protein